jgi:hypothetical protein
MKCPHCLVEFHDSPESFQLGGDPDGEWALIRSVCASCQRFVLRLHQRRRFKTSGGGTVTEGPSQGTVRLVYPKGVSRSPCPPQVPKVLAEDYTEACLVLFVQPEVLIQRKTALNKKLVDAGKPPMK